MLLTLSSLVFWFIVTKKGGEKSVANASQSLVELTYDFMPNLVYEQIDK
jgi:F-type H+-transporting ATPase subunit a